MNTETRAERNTENKQCVDFASMEDNVAQIVAKKAISADEATKLAAIETAIDAIGDGVKEDAIRATALYIEVVAAHDTAKTNADSVVTANQLALAELNTRVASDDDYTAPQKQDFLDAKNNEV